MNDKVERLPLGALAQQIGGPIDVFLCSASYEDRCVSIASTLASMSDLWHPVIFVNARTAPQAYRNVERLQEMFGGRAKKVVIDKSSPVRTADQFQMVLSRVVDSSRPQRYVIDVTTFTHESLLILLRILQEQVRSVDSVQLVYATAAEYGVGLKDTEKWLSKGVQDVRSVLGYPGIVRPSRRSHIVVLVGFESERAAELIESYEPNVVSLGFGDEASATEMGHHAINRMAFHTLARKVQSFNEFVFSTSDPFLAEAAIRAQAEKVPDCNVLIAPMNTKISTVGAAGVAFANDEIRLCYASAVQYNTEAYSRPGGHCYRMELPFAFWRPRERTSSSKGLT